jgi:hypothetical protein
MYRSMLWRIIWRSSTTLDCRYHEVKSYIPEGENESCATYGKRITSKIELNMRYTVQNIIVAAIHQQQINRLGRCSKTSIPLHHITHCFSLKATRNFRHSKEAQPF